ncbi:hypothetical protein CARUB_v10011450mg [Capsella rubella]|uniref:S-protein homolog n=1 Tax=Capsella rubella TaxID=81985 RepID=R0IHH2_9BRAS|nr:S-protein homolog 21 [Capsella rubella]EOA37855.1 hypothetical protein CARUB_v10011450mg [Capsella rubella]
MKNITILFFLVVLALCMIDNAYSKNPFKGKLTTLYFRNDLSHNKWLKVRCKSGDKDVHEKYMGPVHDWSFSFHDKFLGGTLYWCTLSKGPDYKVHRTFDAYVQDNRKPHGTYYSYIAREDGIYHITMVYGVRKVLDW